MISEASKDIRRHHLLPTTAFEGNSLPLKSSTFPLYTTISLYKEVFGIVQEYLDLIRV